MKLPSAAIAVLLVASSVAFAAGREDLDDVASESVPDAVLEALEKFSHSKDYAISVHINPFFLQGDYNGDRKLDTAILIKEKSTGKSGIAIVYGGSSVVTLLGAGRDTTGSNDFRWMDAWSTYPRGPVGRGAGEVGPPPKLKGDALLVIRSRSASGLIYWTGKGYRWYQQGD